MNNAILRSSLPSSQNPDEYGNCLFFFSFPLRFNFRYYIYLQEINSYHKLSVFFFRRQAKVFDLKQLHILSEFPSTMFTYSDLFQLPVQRIFLLQLRKQSPY